MNIGNGKYVNYGDEAYGIRELLLCPYHAQELIISSMNKAEICV